MAGRKIYTDVERAQMREWVERWAWVGPELDRRRWEELRRVNTAEAVEALSEATEHALRTMPVRESSGFVEMHRVLMGKRRRIS